MNRVRENTVVVEQILKNDRSVALQGDLGNAVRQAVIQSLLAEGELAQIALRDKQVLAGFTGIIYDLVKQNQVWMYPGQ